MIVKKPINAYAFGVGGEACVCETREALAAWFRGFALKVRFIRTFHDNQQQEAN